MALALLAWSFVAAVRHTADPAGATLATTLDTAAARAQLGAWTRQSALERLHLTLTSPPGAEGRDWLRALDEAGTVVTWEGKIPATAIAAEALADPRGGIRIGVAAPGGASVLVTDAVGRVDSLEARAGGASLRVPSSTGAIAARAAGVTATVPQPARRDRGEVVVLGRAGWEAKFVVAALEEQGWRVQARFRVAPGLSVGDVPALDTARISTVIALDSTAADRAAAIAAYVRSGGGLVVGSDAARIPTLASLLPGRPGPAVRAASSYAAAIAPVTRLTLAHAPITALRRDAVPLERRGEAVLVAARRVDAGRVVQSGYDETWRWRMAGPAESPDAHRAWWSSLVESVAYAQLLPAAPPASTTEPAPRAALVAALGMPSAAPEGAADAPGFDPSRSGIVYIAIALLLLAEWGSRRLRGRL